MATYISSQFQNLQSVAAKYRRSYRNAAPYPHIVFDDFFDPETLSKIANEYPDLSLDPSVNRNSNGTEIKLSSARGDRQQTDCCRNFLRYLNSHEFLDFLQTLTAIKEPLIPDPHFIGGGMHEIKCGGLLKIHADFRRHLENNLDRRINLLIHLNHDWLDSYGGHLQLWDAKMSRCENKILPLFNRVVIFNTNDFTYHGHPDPVTCPPNRSRRSLALYYYSNGRPLGEIRSANLENGTHFQARPGETLIFEKESILRISKKNSPRSYSSCTIFNWQAF